MLESIDILIGLAVVMLVVSMGVTLITQALLDAFQSRGRYLLQGLTDLLVQVHPNIGPECAKQISEAILKHPVIRTARNRMGTAIKREDLTQLLLEFGAARAAPSTTMSASAPAGTPTVVTGARSQENPFCALPDAAWEKLVEALQLNGIADPSAILTGIRARALDLERVAPQLAAAERQAAAVLEEANTEFVAKVHAWFDGTMDRVSERFTQHARTVTLLASAVVVVALQLDTLSLVNRLSVDDNMRSALVQQGMGIRANTLEDAHQLATDYAKAVNATGTLRVPRNTDEWLSHWENVNPGGLLISILLLSMGAPFWYNVLSRLIQLRSVIAQKDDQDRKHRQESQATVSAGSPVSGVIRG
jgi:hypothetical protein